jgi:hypothetical protein
MAGRSSRWMVVSSVAALVIACASRPRTEEPQGVRAVAAVVVPAVSASAAEPAAGEVGTVRGAEERLAEFTRAGADTTKLTLGLKPSHEDLRAIFDESVLGAVADHVEELFRTMEPGLKLDDKPDVRCFSSDDIKAWTLEVKDNMPGGYQRVGPKLQPGLTFCRFKAGGISYDSLVFVRHHWVLVPKPFRVIKD